MEPVYTAHLCRPLHNHLLTLLRGLSAEQWMLPTVCAGWAVRDIAAHLLDTQIRRISTAPAAKFDNLVLYLNQLNADWVRAFERVDPALIIEFLAITGPRVAEHFDRLDMNARARFPVAWAGDEASPNWFDIGREYTEWWHHQQQIRDAVGAEPLTSREWLGPVLELFVRALPFSYRGVTDRVTVRITGEAGGVWSLVDGELDQGDCGAAACRVTVDQEAAWRILTRQKVTGGVEIEGRRDLGTIFLKTLAIMA